MKMQFNNIIDFFKHLQGGTMAEKNESSIDILNRIKDNGSEKVELEMRLGRDIAKLFAGLNDNLGLLMNRVDAIEKKLGDDGEKENKKTEK